MTLSLNANAPLDGVQAPIIGAVDPEENKPTDHDRANGIDIFSDGGETVETLTSVVENFFNPEGMEESGIAEHHQFATEEDDRQYEKLSFAVESFSQLYSAVKAEGMSVQAANEAVAINPDIGLRKAHMYTTVPSGTLLAPSLEAFSEQIKNFLQKLLGWISKAWKKLKEKANSIFKRDHAKKSEETDAKLEELDNKLQSEGKREEDVVTEAVKQAETKGPEAKKAATGKEKQLIEMAQAVVNKSQTNPWVAHALGTLRVVDVIRQMSAVAGEVQSVISGSVGNIRPGSAVKLNEAAAKLVSSRFFTMGNSLNVAKTEAVPNKDTISSVRDAVAIFTLLRKNRDQQSSSIDAVIKNLQSVNNSIAESDKALDSLENLNNLGDFDDSERAAVKTFTDSIKQAGSHLNDILDFVHAISMINEQLLRYGNLMLGAMFGTDEGTGNESIDIPGLELLGWVSAAESQVNNIFDYFGDLDEAAFEQELERDRMEMDPGIPAAESYDSAGPLGVGDNPASFNMDAIRNVRGVEALEAFDGVGTKIKKAIEWIRNKIVQAIARFRNWIKQVRYGSDEELDIAKVKLEAILNKQDSGLDGDKARLERVAKIMGTSYRVSTLLKMANLRADAEARKTVDSMLRAYSDFMKALDEVRPGVELAPINAKLKQSYDALSAAQEELVKNGKTDITLPNNIRTLVNNYLTDLKVVQDRIIPSNLNISSLAEKASDTAFKAQMALTNVDEKEALETVNMAHRFVKASTYVAHLLTAHSENQLNTLNMLISALSKSTFSSESYDDEGDDYEDYEDEEEDYGNERFNVQQVMRDAGKWIMERVRTMIAKLRTWYEKVRGTATPEQIASQLDELEKALGAIDTSKDLQGKAGESFTQSVNNLIKQTYGYSRLMSIIASKDAATAQSLLELTMEKYQQFLKDAQSAISSGDMARTSTVTKEGLAGLTEVRDQVISLAGNGADVIKGNPVETIKAFLANAKQAEKILPADTDMSKLLDQISQAFNTLASKVKSDENDANAKAVVQDLEATGRMASFIVREMGGITNSYSRVVGKLLKMISSLKSGSTEASTESSLHDQSEGLFSDVPRALRGIPREPIEDEPRRIEESSGLLGTPYGASAVYAQYP